METPKVPVSWGELLDKITILEIKAARIIDSAALKNVTNELESLLYIKNQLSSDNQNLTRLISELSQINTSLWDVEDRLREKEIQQIFDDDFISLARSVYKKNDERARVKRRINEYLDSKIIEEKSYASY